MRKGALEEASALAVKIGRGIARHNSRELRKLDEKACPKDLWECVNSLTHPRKTMAGCKVTADELNQHFAATSTDNSYQQVDLKTTANLNQHNTSSLMSRYSMFSITCDQLQRVLMDFRHGSSGCWLRSALDQLPDLSTNLCVAHGSHDNGKLPLFTRHQKSRRLRVHLTIDLYRSYQSCLEWWRDWWCTPTYIQLYSTTVCRLHQRSICLSTNEVHYSRS